MDKLLVRIAENPVLSYYAIAFFVIVSLFFALLYYMILPLFTGYPPLSYATGEVSGEEVVNFVDCLYFSATTQATVGYGDIIPTSVSGKTCSTIQGVFGYLYLAFLVAIFTAKAVLKSKQFRALCRK